MKSEVYIMQDRISCVYGEIFESPNDAFMIRSFKKAIEASKALGDFFREDIVVLHLGSLIKEEHNVRFVPCEIPHIVCKGSDFDVCTREATAVAPAADSV